MPNHYEHFGDFRGETTDQKCQKSQEKSAVRVGPRNLEMKEGLPKLGVPYWGPDYRVCMRGDQTSLLHPHTHLPSGSGCCAVDTASQSASLKGKQKGRRTSEVRKNRKLYRV